MADAGIILPLQGCRFRELTVFQDFFCCGGGIAIVIFEKSNLGSGEPPFFDGRNSLHDINAPLHGVIYLIFEEQARHFNVITNLFAAPGSNFFCAYCNKGFRRIEQHKCKRTCECCFVTPPCRCDGAEMVEFVDCGRKFFGHSCFINHKSAGSYKKNKKCATSCGYVKIV